MTKEYTAQSCHSIGYKWDITAPANLTEEQVEAVIDALIEWTDTPDNEALKAMIKDQGGICGISTADMLKIDIYVESVHREAFSQEIECTSEEEEEAA